MSEEIFKNIRQIQLYLAERYRVTYYRVQKACERRELVERRGGGWSVRTVEQWARAFLTPKVDNSPDADAPSLPADEQEMPLGGVAEEKLRQQSRLLDLQAQKQEMELRKAQGIYTRTEIIEDELAARARAFRLGLERFGHERGQDVAAVFGATPKLARQLAERLGFTEEEDQQRAQVLIQDFLLSRAPQFGIFFAGAVEELLDSYATGRWWTEDMQAAWQKLEEGGAHE